MHEGYSVLTNVIVSCDMTWQEICIKKWQIKLKEYFLTKIHCEISSKMMFEGFSPYKRPNNLNNVILEDEGKIWYFNCNCSLL